MLLPPDRRVRLEVEVDGRHLTYLLTALCEAGFGVQVVGSAVVFREIMALRKSVRIPFVIGGRERDCGISISDRPSTLDSERSTLFVLDYDYFSGLPAEVVKGGAEKPSTRNPSLATAPEVPMLDSRPSSLDSSSQALRMPYFMHPSVYHRGLHKRRSLGTALDPRPSSPWPVKGETSFTGLDSAAKQRRRFRIGFFGTHDREFYTKHYHFPGMNRFEILEVFLHKFGRQLTEVSGSPDAWPDSSMVISIDSKGGDRDGKTFLAQDDYFAALQQCDFVLSPPGICMPLSHNLIEAMMCGAIPITNAGEYMSPTLENCRTCLEFKNANSLETALEQALAMETRDVAKMRLKVASYYRVFLDPRSFGRILAKTTAKDILVNAEEKSVPLAYPQFVWPPPPVN